MSKSLADIWKLKKRGQRDSERHKELVKEAIKKSGKDLITEYNIIKSDGSKKVKVPIKFLEKYKFKYGDLSTQKGTGQGAKVKPGQTFRNKKSKQKGQGNGQAGDEPGERTYEAEVSIDELVDILIDELNLPWLKETESSEIVVEKEEFTSYEKVGIRPNLDLKQTILQNIKRNAAKGNAVVGDFHESDFRYKQWEDKKEYHSSAVVYMLLDRSASMDKEKTKVAKTFFFWMVQFLKRKYQSVDMVFIAHDVDAFICTEDEFFKVNAAGGTKCSSAIRLANQHMKEHYSSGEKCIYVSHFSDGDNYGDDNLLVLETMLEMMDRVTAMSYMEVIPKDLLHYPWYSEDKLLSNLLDQEIQRTRFVSDRLSSVDDVYGALKKFFNIDGKKK